MTKEMPTIDRTFAYVELRREMATEDIEVKTPEDYSYDLSPEQTRLYLLQLGIPVLKREKALDKLWNFYAIRIDLQDDGEYRVTTLDPPTYPDVMGSRPLDGMEWVIGSGKQI